MSSYEFETHEPVDLYVREGSPQLHPRHHGDRLRQRFDREDEIHVEGSEDENHARLRSAAGPGRSKTVIMRIQSAGWITPANSSSPTI